MAGSIAFDAPSGQLLFQADVGSSNATLAPSQTNPNNIVATIDGTSREFAAADVKLVYFLSSEEGGDNFVNSTNELAIGFLHGSGNTFVGGTGSNIVIDYAGNSDLDSNGGPIQYINASDPSVGHGISYRTTRSGNLIVTAY